MKILLTIILFSILLIAFPLSVNAAEVQKTNYDLPYPGILPDSPFYILKMLRDNIQGFFISGMLKKAVFDLNCADARVSSANSMIEKKKSIDLAESTFSKAENYFDDAINKTQEAKSQGMDTREIGQRLILANNKYLEVIADIDKGLSNKDRKKFETVKKRAEQDASAVEKLGKE